jgi:hypothetical protein
MNVKKRYFMRGLGLGILVTAVILTISHANNRMTDDKAIKRVKEMGYEIKKADPATTHAIDMESIRSKLTNTPLPNGDVPESTEPLPNGDKPEDTEPLPNGDRPSDLMSPEEDE